MARNRERKRQYEKEYYRKNHARRLAQKTKYFRKYLYGIDHKQYLQMILDQNNVCAICKQPETELTQNKDIRPLSVDHDHTTNQVRGLLCNACNNMLGRAKENISTLENAIKYLKSHIQKAIL